MALREAPSGLPPTVRVGETYIQTRHNPVNSLPRTAKLFSRKGAIGKSNCDALSALAISGSYEGP